MYRSVKRCRRRLPFRTSRPRTVTAGCPGGRVRALGRRSGVGSGRGLRPDCDSESLGRTRCTARSVAPVQVDSCSTSAGPPSARHTPGARPWIGGHRDGYCDAGGGSSTVGHPCGHGHCVAILGRQFIALMLRVVESLCTAAAQLGREARWDRRPDIRATGRAAACERASGRANRARGFSAPASSAKPRGPDPPRHGIRMVRLAAEPRRAARRDWSRPCADWPSRITAVPRGTGVRSRGS